MSSSGDDVADESADPTVHSTGHGPDAVFDKDRCRASEKAHHNFQVYESAAVARAKGTIELRFKLLAHIESTVRSRALSGEYTEDFGCLRQVVFGNQPPSGTLASGVPQSVEECRLVSVLARPECGHACLDAIQILPTMLAHKPQPDVQGCRPYPAAPVVAVHMEPGDPVIDEESAHVCAPIAKDGHASKTKQPLCCFDRFQWPRNCSAHLERVRARLSQCVGMIVVGKQVEQQSFQHRPDFAKFVCVPVFDSLHAEGCRDATPTRFHLRAVDSILPDGFKEPTHAPPPRTAGNSEMDTGTYQAWISTRTGEGRRLPKCRARLSTSISLLSVSRSRTPTSNRSLPDEFRYRPTASRYTATNLRVRHRARSHLSRLCCTARFVALVSSCQVIPLRPYITCGGTRASDDVLTSPNSSANPRASRQNPTKSAPGRLAPGVLRSRTWFHG